jgi:hypothetical protein
MKLTCRLLALPVLIALLSACGEKALILWLTQK